MSITFTKAYQANGQTYATLEDAQRAALAAFFPETSNAWEKDSIAFTILECADAIVDILTTTASSRPKARSFNGGKKTRKPKQPADAAVNAALQDQDA